MHRGWVRLYRKSEDNTLYFAEPFTRWQAWQDLLLLANHKEDTIFIKGHMIKVEAGQLAYSMVSLATRWQWHRDKVKRFLTQLQTLQQIQHQNTNVTTLITIINYKQYSDGTTANTTAHTTSDTTSDTTQTRMFKKKEKNTYDASFQTFWQIYPNKKAKQTAYKSWVKLSPSEELINTIHDALKEHIKSEDWAKDNGQFIPHPSTWLNGKRWEDVLIPAKPTRWTPE